MKPKVTGSDLSTTVLERFSLARPGKYLGKSTPKVDGYLERLTFSTEPAAARLEEAMRYSLLAGGKRIRPVLALATAQALGREPHSILPLAAAPRW